MNNQTTKTKEKMNGGKGEVCVFSFLRKKKWLSALMALVFLLNVCSPAWARDGNYGPKGSLESFASGAFAGVVTAISAIINPVGAVAGSVAGDLTGLYMYYNYYSTYGQTIKIGNWDTGISQGQFWSMVVGIGASAAAGYIAGVIAGPNATPPPSTPFEQAVKDFFHVPVGQNMYAGYGASGQIGYALLSLAGDLVLGTVRLALTEGIKNGLKKLKKDNGWEWDEAIDTIIAELTSTVVGGFLTPYVRYAFGGIASLFGNKYILGNQGQYLDAGKAEYADATYTITNADGTTKTVSAQEYAAMSLADDTNVTVNFKGRPAGQPTSETTTAGALKPVFQNAVVVLLVGNQNTTVTAANGNKYKMSQVTGAQNITKSADGSSYTMTIGGEQVTFSAAEFNKFLGCISMASSYQNTADRTGGFMTDTRGNPVNPWLSGFQVVQNMGLAPYVAAGAKVGMLLLLKYRSHHGSNKERIFENAWKMAVADFVSNLFAGAINNWDALNSWYAGTSNNDNPWKTRGNLDFGEYFAKEFATQLALLGANVGWAAYCKAANITPGVIAELGHLAAGSLISGLADLAMRSDPGEAEKDQILVYDPATQSYRYEDIENVVYNKETGTYTVNDVAVTVITDPEKQFLTDRNGNVLVNINGEYSFVKLSDVTYDPVSGTYKLKGGESLDIVHKLDSGMILIRDSNGDLKQWSASEPLPEGATAVTFNLPKAETVGGQTVLTYNVSLPGAGGNQVFIQDTATGEYKFVKAEELTFKDGAYSLNGAAVTIKEVGEGDVVLMSIDGEGRTAFYVYNAASPDITHADGKYTRNGQLLSVVSLGERSTDVVGGQTVYSFTNAIDVTSLMGDDNFYNYRKNLTIGKFFVCTIEDFNNYVVQAAARSAIYASPNFSLSNGMNAFMAQQQMQDAMAAHISGIAQGAAPSQLVASRFTANLNYFASANIAESFGAAFSNPFLKLEHRSFATFITNAERVDYMRKLAEQERSQRQALVSDLELMSGFDTEFGGDMARLDAQITDIDRQIKELTEGIGSGDTSSIYAKGQQISSLYMQKSRLTRMKELEGRRDAVNNQILQQAYRLGLITQNEIYTRPQEALARVAELMPGVLEKLKGEVDVYNKRIEGMRNSSGALGVLGLLPVIGALGQVVVLSNMALVNKGNYEFNDLIIGGIVDYNVSRTLTRSAPMSSYMRNTLRDYVKNNAEKLGLTETQRDGFLYTLGEEGADKRNELLVSSYSFSAAGVYQGSETYGKVSLLTVNNVSRLLNLQVQTQKADTPLVVEGGIVTVGLSFEEIAGRLADLDKQLNAEGLTTEGRTALEKQKEELVSIRTVMELRKAHPEFTAFTWIPGDPESRKQDVYKAIDELGKGRMLYSDYGLLSRTTVDQFGRAKETMQYAPKFDGREWQNVRQDVFIQHYHGPFGHTLSKTADYTQIRIPSQVDWPGLAEWKGALGGLWDRMTTEFNSCGVQSIELAKNLGIIAADDETAYTAEQLKNKFVSYMQAEVGKDPAILARVNDAIVAFALKTNRDTYFNNLSGQIAAAKTAGVGDADIIAGLLQACPALAGQEFTSLDALVTAMQGLELSALPTQTITVTGNSVLDTTPKSVAGDFSGYIPPFSVTYGEDGTTVESVFVSPESSQYKLLQGASDALLRGEAIPYTYAEKEYELTAAKFTNEEVRGYIERFKADPALMKELEDFAESVWGVRVTLEMNTLWGAIVSYLVLNPQPDGRNWGDLTAGEKRAVLQGTIGWRLMTYALYERDNVPQTLQDNTCTRYFYPGSDADSVNFAKLGTVYLPVIAAPKPVSADVALSTEPVGDVGKVTGPEYRPVSIGVNYNYDVSLYSTENGRSAYAGPTHRITYANINSGPSLQYGAQYSLRPDLLQRQLGKLVDDYARTEFAAGTEQRTRLVNFLQGLGFTETEITAKLDSLVAGAKSDLEEIGILDVSIKSIPDASAQRTIGIQRDKLVEGMVSRAISTLGQDGVVSDALTRKQADLNAALSSDLANIQQGQFYRYEDIDGETLALPTWGVSIGKALAVDPGVTQRRLDGLIEDYARTGFTGDEQRGRLVTFLQQNLGLSTGVITAKLDSLKAGAAPAMQEIGILDESVKLVPDNEPALGNVITQRDKIFEEMVSTAVASFGKDTEIAVAVEASPVYRQEERFNKLFNYSYNNASILASMARGRVDAANAGNKILENMIIGSSVYPLASGMRFVMEPNNNDILGAYYDRLNTIYLPDEFTALFPDGISYEGRGTLDIISKRDLIK